MLGTEIAGKGIAEDSTKSTIADPEPSFPVLSYHSGTLDGGRLIYWRSDGATGC